MISLVSGTYNRLPLLKEMVASARASAGDLPLEIVLVDGGSTDGTQEWCKEQPDVVLIEQGELLGAIKAYNAGCEVAQGRYLVIGNDDVTFDGDTIQTAYRYLENNPEVGQAAFKHRYQRRGESAKAGLVQHAYGYLYGQCCMTRKWLGDWAGWWGTDGMRTYGGDTRLGLRLWELGWPVVAVQNCSVTDTEHQDELREINSDTPWQQARADGTRHPDLLAFGAKWIGRMPKRDEWLAAPSRRVLTKAMNGNLRSLRFKAMMRNKDQPRTALIDALAAYGPAMQAVMPHPGHGKRIDQNLYLNAVKEFNPDLILFQAQRDNYVSVETVKRIKRERPWVFVVNWDGDTHYPLTDWHYEIAAAVDLQLIVSPSWFGHYAARGIGVGYWPIGIERAYIEAKRGEGPFQPDVLFTGTLYGEGHFPGAEFRRDAVLALARSDLDFGLYGTQWERVGLEAASTGEQHVENAAMMASAKMTLSISQASDLWGYTSDRLYNITATGCPALVQRFAGMEQHGYVDGETCIAFETFAEMLEKARYYTEHDDEREAIGAAGRVMTLERHTWARRLDGLWAMLEGLP